MIKNDLVTILKEESMLMNSLMNLIIPFMRQKFPSYMIQLVTLLNFLLVIATTMKEEVIRTLFMIQVHPLMICNGILLLAVIYSYMKCQCIRIK
jgi:hypothetical protein